MKKFTLIAWFQAAVALLVSLYYSEVMHLAVCKLCLWQRICMYPLVLAIPAAVGKRNNFITASVILLGGAGWIIALYQNLLVWGVIPENNYACISDIPCSIQTYRLFGFVTIPLMSLLAFTIINVCMLLWLKSGVREPEMAQSPSE